MAEKPTLLLVDDEPALADYLAAAASHGGYSPQVCADDTEFRDQFRVQRPDMVALDLGMPGMDGIELLRFLAEEEYAGPVMIVSGFDRRILESAFRLGRELGLEMVGPVEKPARLEQLETIFRDSRTRMAG